MQSFKRIDICFITGMPGTLRMNVPYVKNKKKLAELVKSSAEAAEPKLAIRDPYIFEFLGLKPKEVMGESALEDRLLDKLQEFLLELGHGFCFEARQKRILIGDTHNFVDLSRSNFLKRKKCSAS